MINITSTLNPGISYSVSCSTNSDPVIDWYEISIHNKIRDDASMWFWLRLDGTIDQKPYTYVNANPFIHMHVQHKNSYK